MRGNWCCPSTWQWPDPHRQAFWPAALLAVLGLLLTGLSSPGGQAPEGAAEAQTANAGAALEAGTRRLLVTSYPELDVAAMLEYYSRTSPDIHAEIRSHVANVSDSTLAYLCRVAEHFVRLDRVRQRNPAEFERLRSLDQLESRARMLGRLIRQLSNAATEGPRDDGAASRAAMNRAKTELRSVLERAFEGTQQNQGIELNRLEAELRTMRRLLDERANKRDLIVRQRFLELCGQDLPPAGATPVVKNDALTPPP